QAFHRQTAAKVLEVCKCLKCGVRIEPLYPDSLSHPMAIDTTVWSGGGAGKISCGFGSEFDLQTYYVFLCDGCIGTGLAERAIMSTHKLSKMCDYYELRNIR
ncbi:MAG TPA: hypothetical protein VEA58_02750, partial [Anaerovoracaceae bacterium]|nr:hypothetical protein [Anaerovoracaceae bacterium]